MKTIFVTGGLGFIGSNFVLSHLKKYPKDRLVVIDKRTYAADIRNLEDVLNRVTLESADIRNLDLMLHLYAQYKPTITYHFAAESHVGNSIVSDDDFVSTNVVGTHNILKCVRASGSRLIHISTDEVYGTVERGKFTEETPYNPRNPYSATKAASDHLVRAYINTHGIDAVITNCSNNYGPRQHAEKFIPVVILNAKANRPIPIHGDGSSVRDWLFVSDHCEAVLRVGAKAAKGERYNIGGECEMNILDTAKLVLDMMGKPHSLLEFVPNRPGHDQHYAMEINKVRKAFKWSPATSFENGLKQTLAWYGA